LIVWCSTGLIRAGGTLVSVVGPTEARPADGLAVDFVVESDRAQLGEIVQRVRDGRLRTSIGNVATLDDAIAGLNPTERRKGKTIIRVRPQSTISRDGGARARLTCDASERHRDRRAGGGRRPKPGSP